MNEDSVLALVVGLILVAEIAFMIAMQSSVRFESVMTSVWDVVVRYTGEPVWRVLSWVSRSIETGVQAVIERAVKR
ncbi:hypothetical protein KK103_12030 [Curtobacterium flaccumfaciens pv. flaccumfaciens]|uniref:Uncharacterized protein n=1 Tax=Curtobacterium flaccumfaciens pv. flaccumfaciens TaxID=138532 RepID=A0A9Q2ZNE7_9MICO|nr:hypothetical protein [Curtobacterium flaccumfaciens]MBT1542494.1 hypothetical protein [Curtobacterium flaccumfaciens pv. flaccumfaciens]